MRFHLPITFAFAAALSASVAAAAPPEITPVPAPKASEWVELKVAAGEVVVLSAQPASEWDTLDASPPHTFEQGRYAVFLLAAGDRKRVVVTGPDKAKSRLVLVATGEPMPKPPEPKPKDELRERLKAAYDADAGADRRESVKLLVELYRQLAEKVCPDRAVTTVGDLLARARDVSGLLLKAEQLPGVRQVVAKELGLLFPADGPLSDEQRKRAADLFTKLASVLGDF